MAEERNTPNSASPLHAASASATDSPAPSLTAHYDHKRDVILTMESMSDAAMKRITLVVWGATAAGLAFLIATLVIKLTRSQSYFFRNQALYLVNVSLACVQIGALCILICFIVWRVLRARRSRKRWSPRRLRMVQFSAFEISLQMINSVFFLAPNVREVAVPCTWFSPLVAWTAFVRWTVWNTLFLLFVVQASNLMPLKSTAAAERTGRSDPLYLDAPTIWVHWPKLPLWVAMEACLLALTVEIVRGETSFGGTEGSGTGNCREATYTCSFSKAGSVLANVVAALAILYLFVYIAMVRRVFQNFYQLPYSQYRIGNLAIRLQVRLRGLAFAFFVATIIGYFYIDIGTCSSYILSWYGLTPMQLVMTIVAATQGYLALPNRPGQTSILQVWLQEFAWSERDIERKRCERSSSLPQDSFEGFCMDCEPLFCFETAIKLMYWSFLAYDAEEITGSSFSQETALGLFGLKHFDVVWEKRTNAKAVIGWDEGNTVVIAFRGTVNMANVLSDIQVWRTALTRPGELQERNPRRFPLSLGPIPMVHRGFLRTYTTGSFNERLLGHVRHILNRCQDAQRVSESPDRPVDVLITGHSLGGALAVLCAYDIATGGPCADFDLNIKCYTFGAPRVGNHTWAGLYNTVVPDTWQLINSDDAFTRAGKFWFLYKHVGHRVLLNKFGDLVVRPSFVEYSIRRSPGGSVGDHYLTAYQQAVIAVIVAQFGAKSLGDKEGVILLTKQPGNN